MNQPRPELCVGAVAVRHDHLLLIQRGTDPELGKWSLPGGRVEGGESIVEAVVREMREETGLDAVFDGVVGWAERLSSNHHFFIMDAAGSDAQDVRWVPLWQVSELALVEGLLDFLADHDIIRAL